MLCNVNLEKSFSQRYLNECVWLTISETEIRVKAGFFLLVEGTARPWFSAHRHLSKVKKKNALLRFVFLIVSVTRWCFVYHVVQSSSKPGEKREIPHCGPDGVRREACKCAM